MSNSIKKAETEIEFEKISELAKEIWTEYYTSLIGPTQTAYMISKFQSADRIREDIKKRGYSYFAVYENSGRNPSSSADIPDRGNNFGVIKPKPIGYFALQPDDKGVFISKIYILKEYRRRGIAGEIIRFSVCFAQKAVESSETKFDAEQYEKPRLWLTVNKKNTGSIEFYKKNGFEIIEETVTDIGDGFVMDDYIMAFFFES